MLKISPFRRFRSSRSNPLSTPIAPSAIESSAHRRAQRSPLPLRPPYPLRPSLQCHPSRRCRRYTDDRRLRTFGGNLKAPELGEIRGDPFHRPSLVCGRHSGRTLRAGESLRALDGSPGGPTVGRTPFSRLRPCSIPPHWSATSTTRSGRESLPAPFSPEAPWCEFKGV